MHSAAEPQWIVLSTLIVVVLGLTRLAVKVSIHRMGGPEKARERVRRGAGNAALLGRSFIEPSVEEILVARSERAETDDVEAGGDPADESAMLERLVAALTAPDIDLARLRGETTRARDAGLDWARLYDEAASRVFQTRPHLVPRLPPRNRVAPFAEGRRGRDERTAEGRPTRDSGSRGEIEGNRAADEL